MKKAIVVGASSGIGLELARVLAAHQYKVGITGRRTPLLEDLQKEAPTSYLVQTLDNTDLAAIPASLGSLAAALGGVDLLIISSGTGFVNKPFDFEPELTTIDTNVRGFAAIANWAFRLFEQQGYGHLVGISSVAGMRGSRLAPAYNASKAFQINLLEGLRQKANKIKAPIFVSDIRPGFVATDMAKGDGLFWVSSPEKAARQIFKAINRKKRYAYVTKRWVTLAVLLKIIPGFIYEHL